MDHRNQKSLQTCVDIWVFELIPDGISSNKEAVLRTFIKFTRKVWSWQPVAIDPDMAK